MAPFPQNDGCILIRPIARVGQLAWPVLMGFMVMDVFVMVMIMIMIILMVMMAVILSVNVTFV